MSDFTATSLASWERTDFEQGTDTTGLTDREFDAMLPILTAPPVKRRGNCWACDGARMKRPRLLESDGCCAACHATIETKRRLLAAQRSKGL